VLECSLLEKKKGRESVVGEKNNVISNKVCCMPFGHTFICFMPVIRSDMRKFKPIFISTWVYTSQNEDLKIKWVRISCSNALYGTRDVNVALNIQIILSEYNACGSDIYSRLLSVSMYTTLFISWTHYFWSVFFFQPIFEKSRATKHCWSWCITQHSFRGFSL
jgi:hypothetical protein